MKEIKLKIADTVSECIKDVTGFPNITAGSKSLVGQLTPKLEALFTAETAAMRDIIGRLPNVSCCAWETLEENMGYGEGELQAKIDTVLGGK